MPFSSSDRVTLKKESADRLAAEDWDLIDLGSATALGGMCWRQ
jgi:hypothetical protein